MACVASLVYLAACGDSGTGVADTFALVGSFALEQMGGAPLPITLRKIVSVDPSTGATSSCTEYLTAMSIDVTSSGVTRSESHDLTCDTGSTEVTLLFESGTASKTVDGWRFDFVSTDGAYATHYFGRLDGATLTISRRETEVTPTPPVAPPLENADLTQLVFKRR